MDLIAETLVLLEGGAQPPAQCVHLLVSNCRLRGDMVLSAGPDIELVFEVGVPVGEDVPFHIGFRGEPDDGDGTGGAQGLPGQQAFDCCSDLSAFVISVHR